MASLMKPALCVVLFLLGTMGLATCRVRCKANSDCTTPSECVQVPLHEPEANRYCLNPSPKPVPPYPCSDPVQPGNQCCTDANCTQGEHGRCQPFSVGYCGGAAPPQTNVCSYDECGKLAKCSPGKSCLPPTFGSTRYSCATQECSKNGDCRARAGGVCFPYDVAYCYHGQMT